MREGGIHQIGGSGLTAIYFGGYPLHATIPSPVRRPHPLRGHLHPPSPPTSSTHSTPKTAHKCENIMLLRPNSPTQHIQQTGGKQPREGQ